MAGIKTSKLRLQKNLKLSLNSFITKNTFTLKELQLLEKNLRPFPLSHKKHAVG
ncbi:MAG: hypothetical protein KKH94_04805 [Candidatus Omnitrophica bacterium]|nr:hypothetical protein [Candidatus Omnitrophota bacterium]